MHTCSRYCLGTLALDVFHIQYCIFDDKFSVLHQSKDIVKCKTVSHIQTGQNVSSIVETKL